MNMVNRHSFSRHFKIARLEEIMSVIAAEMTALIRVNHYRLLRFSPLDSHQQSVQGQLAVYPLSH